MQWSSLVRLHKLHSDSNACNSHDMPEESMAKEREKDAPPSCQEYRGMRVYLSDNDSAQV